MAKPALGRGLGALLGGSSAPQVDVPGTAAGPRPDAAGVQSVPIDQIRRSPFQPRKDFSVEALQELADSIKVQGILQPLVVRRQADHFELIAGERRWRAAQLAGLTQVPIIVRPADDIQALEMALIENLQREDLNPIEEALGYAQLVEQFQLRQEDVAAKVGKSRTVVANALRLLKLPADVQNYVRDGRLSQGHAKVILGLTSPDHQTLAAERVLRGALNVRQTEELVAHLQDPAGSPPPKHSGGNGASTAPRDPHIASLEARLQERFGTRVHLRYRKGKGSLDIRFFNDEDLQRILSLVGVQAD